MLEILYNALATKYWRDWLVIVYNPVIGGDAHYVWECGGFYKPRYNNPNLLISSVDCSKPTIDIKLVQSQLESFDTTYFRTGSRNAGDIFRWFPPDIRTQFSPFASVGVIKYTNMASYVGNRRRFNLKQLGLYVGTTFFAHMFG